MKNVIIDTFKDSLILIKKYKYFIMLIFLIQLVFFSLLGVNIIATMMPAMEATKEVLAYVGQLDLDEESFAESITTNKSLFGDDPLLIHRNYRVIMEFIKIFLTIAVILFVIFEGLNWTLTHHLIKKRTFKIFLRYMLNFFILTIGYFLIIATIVYNQLQSIVHSAELPAFQIVSSLVVVLLLVYFIPISFSLLNNKKLLTIIKKTFLIGVFKAYVILPTIILVTILITSTSFLLFKTVESNLFLMTFSLILFTFSFIFTRIFFVRLIHEIDIAKNTNN